VIVAFTWLSEQPAEAHDLWWGRRDRAARQTARLLKYPALHRADLTRLNEQRG
jgi:hypothetical protein